MVLADESLTFSVIIIQCNFSSLSATQLIGLSGGCGQCLLVAEELLVQTASACLQTAYNLVSSERPLHLHIRHTRINKHCSTNVQFASVHVPINEGLKGAL